MPWKCSISAQLIQCDNEGRMLFYKKMEVKTAAEYGSIKHMNDDNKDFSLSS